MPKKIDLTGQRFGQFVVQQEHPDRSKDGKVRWVCKCDCGREHVSSGRELRAGRCKRCKVCNHEWLLERGRKQFPVTHGMSNSPEFRVWHSMIRRCTDPKERGFSDYGGRGITVCESWRTSFQSFYDDMGPRPEGKKNGRALYSVERKDVNGDYCPSNCYWATNEEQARNRTDNVMVTVDGRRMCLFDAAEHFGLSYGLVIGRRHRGWSEDELFKPIGYRRVSYSEAGRRAAASRYGKEAA